MKNSTKQVVVLDNLSSPHIVQAILFLKDENTIREDKIILEAEKIVAQYFKQGHPEEVLAQPKSAVIPWIISGISLLVSMATILFF